MGPKKMPLRAIHSAGGRQPSRRPTRHTRSAACAPPPTGAAITPASEVSRKRRRSMPGWWGSSAGHVKCVALVSTAGDPGAALAGQPDGGVVNAAFQLAAAPVLGQEGVEVVEQAHPR